LCHARKLAGHVYGLAYPDLILSVSAIITPLESNSAHEHSSLINANVSAKLYIGILLKPGHKFDFDKGFKCYLS